MTIVTTIPKLKNGRALIKKYLLSKKKKEELEAMILMEDGQNRKARCFLTITNNMLHQEED